MTPSSYHCYARTHHYMEPISVKYLVFAAEVMSKDTAWHILPK